MGRELNCAEKGRERGGKRRRKKDQQEEERET